MQQPNSEMKFESSRKKTKKAKSMIKLKDPYEKMDKKEEN